MLHPARPLPPATLLLALLLALAAALPAGAAGFLTGPAQGEPSDIAVGYVNARKADLGLTSGDVADLVVRDEVRSSHNGVTHLYLRQRHRGVEVFNGDLDVHVITVRSPAHDRGERPWARPPTPASGGKRSGPRRPSTRSARPAKATSTACSRRWRCRRICITG